MAVLAWSPNTPYAILHISVQAGNSMVFTCLCLLACLLACLLVCTVVPKAPWKCSARCVCAKCGLSAPANEVSRGTALREALLAGFWPEEALGRIGGPEAQTARNVDENVAKCRNVVLGPGGDPRARGGPSPRQRHFTPKCR